MRFPELERRTADILPEYPVDVLRFGKSGLQGDIEYRRIGSKEKFLHTVHFQSSKVFKQECLGKISRHFRLLGMVMDPLYMRLYGLAEDGHLYMHDINGKFTRDLGYPGATTGRQSYLFSFDPKTNKVYPLGQIPEAAGVHHCLLEAERGIIYIGGGLNEIELLTLSRDMPHGRRAYPGPERSWRGVPRSLAVSSDGEGFVDYGVLGVDRSPYYAKIAYQFDSMSTAADGSIFIGESDRRAKLFIYVPGAPVYKGVLNPTNPR